MKNLLEKRLSVKSLLYVVLSFVIMMVIIQARNMKISNDFTDYVEKSGKDTEYYVHVIDSLDKKYNNLYSKLDNLYELNWENVEFWTDYYEIKNKEVALAQIKVESANLKSNICVNYGNLVGMHFPQVRKTTADGWIIADHNSKVAVYKFWWKSIEDYKLWQEYFGYDKEVHIDQYLTLLDNHGRSGYATASNYIESVKEAHAENTGNQ